MELKTIEKLIADLRLMKLKNRDLFTVDDFETIEKCISILQELSKTNGIKTKSRTQAIGIQVVTELLKLFADKDFLNFVNDKL